MRLYQEEKTWKGGWLGGGNKGWRKGKRKDAWAGKKKGKGQVKESDANGVNQSKGGQSTSQARQRRAESHFDAKLSETSVTNGQNGRPPKRLCNGAQGRTFCARWYQQYSQQPMQEMDERASTAANATALLCLCDLDVDGLHQRDHLRMPT